MTRLKSSRGPDIPKAKRLDWGGVTVIHRPAGGPCEAYTSLNDCAGGRTLVITSRPGEPVLVRVVRSTPRQKASDRHPVCHWQDVTTLTPDTSAHEAIVAHWAREWGMVAEEAQVAA